MQSCILSEHGCWRTGFEASCQRTYIGLVLARDRNYSVITNRLMCLFFRPFSRDSLLCCSKRWHSAYPCSLQMQREHPIFLITLLESFCQPAMSINGLNLCVQSRRVALLCPPC